MPVKMTGGAASKTGKSSWMKRGKAAQTAFKGEEAKAEAAATAAGKMWRFRIPTKRMEEDFTITFLDGDLDADGLLDVPMYFEHTTLHQGRWSNFPCVSENEPCPLCEAGNNPALVAVCTVIDHTPTTLEKGPNAGKVVKDQRRLFVMKRQTYKMLSKIAKKRGGLTGCTFEVTRSSDKDASVGNMFEFEEKRTLAALNKIYKDKDGKGIAYPADYSQEIVYLDAEKLLSMGVGASVNTVGGNDEPVDGDEGLDDEL